jgi:hypothetical protein
MKLLLITDAWEPQTNGVVTTYKNVIRELKKFNVDTEVIHPGLFRYIPCPGYNEIPIALNTWKIGAMIEAAQPDCVHVAVEGPSAGRRAAFCNARAGATPLRFTHVSRNILMSVCRSPQ